MSFLSEITSGSGYAPQTAPAPEPAVVPDSTPSASFMAMLATNYTLIVDDPDPLGGIRHETRRSSSGRRYSLYYIGEKRFQSLAAARRFKLSSRPPAVTARIARPARPKVVTAAAPAAAATPMAPASSRRSRPIFVPKPYQVSRLRDIL